MKKRHLKFIWGSSEVIKGHWYFGLFGFFDRREGKRDDGLAISMRGVLVLMASLAFVGWLLGATALAWFWQRNTYSLLTWTDAAFYPLRRAEVREKKGQAYIAQGEDELRARHWREGITMLQLGLAYYPGDLRGRLTLGQFYVASGQRPLALKILQDGLETEYPGRPFLQALFDLAEQGEDYDLVVRICERYLPRLKSEADLHDRRWLIARDFAVLLAAKRFDAALALADTEEPSDTANEHRVLALLTGGKYDQTFAALDAWGARPGSDQNAVLRLRARTLREAKRFDEMDRTLDELKARTPADSRAYVYSVVQRAMAGRDGSARAALDDYLFRFGGAAQNLQLVAEPLSEINNRPLLERVAAAANERGYPAQPFEVLLVQTYVQLGDWPAATRTLAAMKPVVGRAAVAGQVWHDWMQKLIEAASGPGDTTGAALVNFLQGRPWPIKIFHKSIDALRAANRLEAARDVIAVASGAFPASAALAGEKAEVEHTLAARQAASVAATVATASALPGEKIYFQRLDDLLHDSQWALAEQLIRDAKSTKPTPPWVDGREGDLRFAQMRVDEGRGETAALIATAKLYLNGDGKRAQQVLDFGRAAFGRGDRETAIALVKEIVRTTPDFTAAQRLLTEWQPKTATKKKG